MWQHLSRAFACAWLCGMLMQASGQVSFFTDPQCTQQVTDENGVGVSYKVGVCIPKIGTTALLPVAFQCNIPLGRALVMTFDTGSLDCAYSDNNQKNPTSQPYLDTCSIFTAVYASLSPPTPYQMYYVLVSCAPTDTQAPLYLPVGVSMSTDATNPLYPKTITKGVAVTVPLAWQTAGTQDPLAMWDTAHPVLTNVDCQTPPTNFDGVNCPADSGCPTPTAAWTVTTQGLNVVTSDTCATSMYIEVQSTTGDVKCADPRLGVDADALTILINGNVGCNIQIGTNVYGRVPLLNSTIQVWAATHFNYDCPSSSDFGGQSGRPATDTLSPSSTYGLDAQNSAYCLGSQYLITGPDGDTKCSNLKIGQKGQLTSCVSNTASEAHTFYTYQDAVAANPATNIWSLRGPGRLCYFFGTPPSAGNYGWQDTYGPPNDLSAALAACITVCQNLNPKLIYLRVSVDDGNCACGTGLQPITGLTDFANLGATSANDALCCENAANINTYSLTGFTGAVASSLFAGNAEAPPGTVTLNSYAFSAPQTQLCTPELSASSGLLNQCTIELSAFPVYYQMSDFVLSFVQQGPPYYTFSMVVAGGVVVDLGPALNLQSFAYPTYAQTSPFATTVYMTLFYGADLSPPYALNCNLALYAEEQFIMNIALTESGACGATYAAQFTAKSSGLSPVFKWASTAQTPSLFYGPTGIRTPTPLDCKNTGVPVVPATCAAVQVVQAQPYDNGSNASNFVNIFSPTQCVTAQAVNPAFSTSAQKASAQIVSFTLECITQGQATAKITFYTDGGCTSPLGGGAPLPVVFQSGYPAITYPGYLPPGQTASFTYSCVWNGIAATYTVPTTLPPTTPAPTTAARATTMAGATTARGSTGTSASTAAATTTGATTRASTGSPTTTGASASSSGSSGLSAGATAAIVVTLFLAAAAAGGLALWWLGCKSRHGATNGAQPEDAKLIELSQTAFSSAAAGKIDM